MSFKYQREELSHGRYMGIPLPPFSGTLLLTRDTERAAAAMRIQEPEPRPANSETNGGFILGAGRVRSGSSTPIQRWVPSDRSPKTNPCPI